MERHISAVCAYGRLVAGVISQIAGTVLAYDFSPACVRNRCGHESNRKKPCKYPQKDFSHIIPRLIREFEFPPTGTALHPAPLPGNLTSVLNYLTFILILEAAVLRVRNYLRCLTFSPFFCRLKSYAE